MEVKLFDSELRLMKLLWEYEPISAKELSLIAAEKIGWNKNTTYTVIKKLVDKEIICRDEPGFICRSAIKEKEVRRVETESLIGRLFNGSKKAFFSALLEDEALSADEIKELKRLINEKKL